MLKVSFRESWSYPNEHDHIWIYCRSVFVFSAAMSIYAGIRCIQKYQTSPQITFKMRSNSGLRRKACGDSGRTSARVGRTGRHWHAAVLSQIPPALLKPTRRISQRQTLSFLLLLGVIFIPQLHSNKHQPPVFFRPHPSFLTPSNFFLPSASLLLFRWLPPLVHNSKNTPHPTIRPPHRLPFSTAAAKNKTGWCGGPMGEAPRWWSSAPPAWALTLNSSTWFCLFNIQSAVGSGVSHSL